MKNTGEKLGIILGTIGLIMILISIITYPTMWLWNYYMPTMFDLPRMTFWDMFGFLMLIKLLFGNYNITTENK
jgi:hypothetical protein